MLIEMKVVQLTVDPLNDMPILILKDAGGRRLPLWIGAIEATSIAAELESIQLDRPMTHDLMNNILGLCAIGVDRVEIHDLKNSTFFATLVLKRPDGGPLTVDARPSDAIALALRARAPIFVAKKVIDKARKRDLPDELPLATAELLAGLSESAFGKWKM
jgi:bifunctional DNase/RNase